MSYGVQYKGETMRKSSLAYAAAIAAAVVGLVAACSRTDCPAPPLDQSAEVTSLANKLAKAEQEREAAVRDASYWKRNSETADRQLDEVRAMNEKLATSYNLASAKVFAGAVERQSLNNEKNIIVMMHNAADQAFAGFGRQVFVSLVDLAMSNSELAWAMYKATKPALKGAAYYLDIDFGGFVRPLLEKKYEPFIGSIAASDGRDCRGELGDGPKSEKCSKILKLIGDYYSIGVSDNLIETLGVMHRRYMADVSDQRKGFDALRGIAIDLMNSSKK